MDYIIALDVGGTSIKSALCQIENQDTITLVNDITTTEIDSNQTPKMLLLDFLSIIQKTFSINDSKAKILGIGIGFPGPFDYVNGISKMRGLAKYEQIYDYPFGETLYKALQQSPLPFIPNFSMKFANDATLFTLGEYHTGLAQGYTRVMCITLGTGCGSSFLENGAIVTHGYGLNNQGMLYNLPFQDSIIDDYLSKRGVLTLAENLDVTPITTVHALAKRAQLREASCIELWNVFGTLCAQALSPIISSFSPDILVFGGNISKAYPLFKQSFLTAISPTVVAVSENLERSALLGAAYLAISTKE